MNDFGIIVLAAGQSSRLGHPKQLVEINSENLLMRQCKLALSITKHVTCVLGFQAEFLKQELSFLPVNIVVNSLWEQGMSSSISAAIRSQPNSIKSVMVLLVDQWQLNNTLLTPLIHTYLDNKNKIITAAKFNEQSQIHTKIKKNSPQVNPHNIGPPTIFPKLYFSTLAGLSGEKGAKRLIIDEIERVVQVDLPEAFIDLDVADDLTVLRHVYPN